MLRKHLKKMSHLSLEKIYIEKKNKNKNKNENWNENNNKNKNKNESKNKTRIKIRVIIEIRIKIEIEIRIKIRIKTKIIYRERLGSDNMERENRKQGGKTKMRMGIKKYNCQGTS